MEREMTMAMTPRVTLERTYINKPSNISSILVSTAGRASRLLADAASAAAMATGDCEKWRPRDHVKYFVMLVAWINVWILRAFMDFFSSPSSIVRSLDFGDLGFDMGRLAATGALVVHGGVGQGQGQGLPSSTNTAIGRALSQVLRILNEIPATSPKYHLLLSLADNLIADNLSHGQVSLHNVTRSALSAAFSRTCELLRRSLYRSSSATWPSRLLRLLPLGPHLAAGYDALRLCFNGVISDYNRSSSRLLSFSGPGLGLEEELESEKLAHEVLWIVNKMMMCEIVEEAIVSWGLEDRLAALSLTANARVQGPIVKISAILLQELARGEWEAPREVKFRILLLWLPVLCYASNGVTRPVLMGLERLEIEVAIEGLILSLPLEDQEAILGNWLKDFAVIDSDWPNLQRCFDCWCRNSRKLLL